MTEIVLIAAVADNGVIGRNGVTPWRLKSDLRRFRALTAGRPVVMGRGTWAGLPARPLPQRTNIVVTRDAAFAAPGALLAPSLESALQAAHGDALRRGTDIMVIGGAQIYAQAMALAQRLAITHVHAAPEGDARFPAIDPAIWRESGRESHAAGPQDDVAYDFVTYLRVDAER